MVRISRSPCTNGTWASSFIYQDARPAGCRGAALCRGRDVPRLWVYPALLVNRHESLAGTEQKRYAPNARQGYDRVNNSADQRGLTSAQPCDDIKAEKTDASPVQCADDGEQKGNSIHNHRHSSLSGFRPLDVSVRERCAVMMGILWHFYGFTPLSQKFTQFCYNRYWCREKNML